MSTEKGFVANPAGRPRGILQEDAGIELPEVGGFQLPNKKHELFCRFVANGETYTNAYELAGYAPSTANASTMAKRPEAIARIEYLKAEKVEQDLRFRIELHKANIDPSQPEAKSRQIAEWSIKAVLDLFYENARLAQMAGQFSSAQASLESIAKIMCLLENGSGNKNDRSTAPQVNIGIYEGVARQLADGGGVSLEGTDNPLAPAISGPKDARRK